MMMPESSTTDRGGLVTATSDASGMTSSALISSGATSGGRRRARERLDRILLTDAVLSLAFGFSALLAPHRLVASLNRTGNADGAGDGGDGGGYSHGAHEALRLYACLRLAIGYILLHLRNVDDGRLRRSVCEALCVCYALQAVVVLRAQFTAEDGEGGILNWMAIGVLSALGSTYGAFRFGRGGDLIKVYELPTSSSKASR